MSEKTINRGVSSGAMILSVPPVPSESGIGTLFDSSLIVDEESPIRIEELQEELNYLRDDSFIVGDPLESSINRWPGVIDVVGDRELQGKSKRIRMRQELVTHIRENISWYGSGTVVLGDHFSSVEIPQKDWYSKVASAESPAEIIELFRQSGVPKFNRIADRLVELQEFHEEDPEGEEPLTIEALRTLASFVKNNQDLPYSHISLCEDKMVYLEWRLHPQGRLAMELLPDGKLINFGAISGTIQSGLERIEVSGILPEKEAIEAVRWFINRIADNE